MAKQRLDNQAYLDWLAKGLERENELNTAIEKAVVLPFNLKRWWPWLFLVGVAMPIWAGLFLAIVIPVQAILLFKVRSIRAKHRKQRALLIQA